MSPEVAAEMRATIDEIRDGAMEIQDSEIVADLLECAAIGDRFLEHHGFGRL